mgnify:CR=1 FL=1
MPSGNLGNVTACYWAKAMGFPLGKIVMATNANATVPDYLATGTYEARASVQTIANAMDVGDPSNVRRINDMYGGDRGRIARDLYSWPYDDQLTSDGIRHMYSRYGYVADPHTSVGFLGLNTYRNKISSDVQGIALSTAHPAKFLDTVSVCVDKEINLPPALSDAMLKKKKSIPTENSFPVFKDKILERYSR